VAEDTIIGMFNARVFELRDQPALRTKDAQGEWSVRTWSDYGREVRALTRALGERGVGAGDAVAVLSGNRAEYHIADLATLALGAVAVPIYHTNAPEQVEYVLDHSEAKVVFCENPAQLAKVAEVRSRLANLDKVITFTEGPADATYDDLVAHGEELDAADPAVYDDGCAKVNPEDLAFLIYTSGTTGPPKGAMLTHANVIWTSNSLLQIIPRHYARLISYLPLAHIAERMVSHYNMINMGGETWFGGGVDTLREDIAACRPTVFFAVPRVWEKFQMAIETRLGELSGVQGALARAARESGARVTTARQENRPVSLRDRVLYPVLDRVVFGKLRRQVGFDDCRAFISGAAPITRETLMFFHSLGIPIAEVYGQTEGCGPTSLNPPDRIKIGTVGPPIPGCDVRIADDDEILVKGGNVFLGYFKNPEATADTLVDGWLHSGDLGRLDDDGYLTITGRKKDLIITAGGKNVSPQNIESALKASHLVSQAVVIGDRRKFLSALITLDEEVVRNWAKDKDLPDDIESLSKTPEVRAAVQAAVDEVNSRLSQVEQIKKFTVLPADFTQEAGEITPTLKVRRHRIEQRYEDAIEEMYR
jgi:long-chain acyl-CoA synthetase